MAEDERSESETVYRLAGPSASGTGYPTDGGFVVRAGSRARSTEVSSTPEGTRRLRRQLINDRVLVPEGDDLVLTNDHRFTSPSQAAAVLLGRSANGWLEWKDPEGRTLKENAGAGRRQEIEFRRRWYEAHVARFESDHDRVEHERATQQAFANSADEALALRDSLARTGDVEAFREGLQAWAVKPGTIAFNGFSGQGFVNQIVKRSDDPRAVATILSDALAAPRDDNDAAAKIQALVDYVETIRVGAYPAPGHTPFLLSYFWALQDHDRWPVLWSSAGAFLEFSTGEPLPAAPAERYLRYLQLVRELERDHRRFWAVAVWWDLTKPVFLDPVLVDRCAFGLEPEAVDDDALAANAAALVSIAGYMGRELVDDLSAAAGRTLSARKPSRRWGQDQPRSDLWVDWETKGESHLGVRLWVNHNGAAIGLRPGWVRSGWYDEATEIVSKAGLPGFRMLSPFSKYGEDVGYGGTGSGFIYARWFEPDQLADLDLRGETTAVAAAVQPLIDELTQLATGEQPPDEDDPLTPLVEEFRARGYPTPADEENKADRERFAEMLAPDAIAFADVADLRRIWNSGRYGGPGPQSVLNTSFRDADAAEYDRILEAIAYLCWGEDDDADRIDALLDTGSQRYVKGLGESVIVKLLAICHPERYVPVFPYSGPKGKRRMLQLLGIDEPTPPEPTRGQLQVQSNDLLRERLDRFFAGDPWGMAQFLYWYAEREDEPEVVPDIDPLDDLAEELLVDREFFDDIVALLENKGQVILYGPPGTGKTYLARKLAEALAPDPTRRALVQFHPSTSYEDFFEGYRPETTLEGDMTYRLVPGPLALLAERAAHAPGKRHVMIIDEINRANLPKVLGELLYLFEYREEQVRTLYRPDDGFQLPKDLWFIGTMNTADRSIALVDAALRRRFHFIPFFPDHGPIQGLLERWLEARGEPRWVGELVAMVNDEIAEALGGPHLQLGASHFMKPGLDVEELRRIWQYNIEPFIEDQFFGDPAQIERFRFDAVLRRYQSEADVGDVAHLPVDEAPGEPLVAEESSELASTEDPEQGSAL